MTKASRRQRIGRVKKKYRIERPQQPSERPPQEALVPSEPSVIIPAESCVRKQRRKRDYEEEERVRSAVSLFYRTTYCENPAEYHGIHDSTPPISPIAFIYRVFGGRIRRDVIRRVVLDTNDALEQSREYTAKRKKSISPGDRSKITQSNDEHYITSLKECTSYEQTSNLFNLLVLTEEGRDAISKSSIFRFIKRTNHRVIKTEIVGQADNSNVFWCRARLHYCAQLLVRLGEALPDDLKMEELEHGNVNCCDAFGYDNLKNENLTIDSVHRIAFWDEIHIQQEAGELRREYPVFPKNEFGVYDKDGEYKEEAPRVSK